jgi:protease I
MQKGSLKGMKVAVLTETEYIPAEMKGYREGLSALGARVDFATNLWGNPSRELVSDVTSPDEKVETMKVDIEVADLRCDDYDIILQAANYTAVRLREIAPMGSHGSVEQTREVPAVKFFADAMRNKRIVKGAMCHALWILTPYPELLRGRRVMCHTVVLSDVHNAGAVYVPNEGNVIVDGDLVTARSLKDLDKYIEALVDTAVNLTKSRAAAH